MTANQYQELAGRTRPAAPDFVISDIEHLLIRNTVGLVGETGEVAELAKKQIFHRQGLDVEKWKNELGDVLWYVAAICTTLDLTMEEVMSHNVAKLRARFPDGYAAERTTDEHKVGLAK